jgi:hypothetical protein
MVRAEEYLKMMMVQKAWSYASHLGGLDPMLGVLHVIKNRIDAGWGVCAHVLETMEKWEAAPPATKKHPDVWERRFQQLLGQIDAIYDGTHRPDVSNNGLYFGDTTNITNPWFLDHVARNPQKMRCANTGSWTYWNNIMGQEVLQPVSIA